VYTTANKVVTTTDYILRGKKMIPFWLIVTIAGLVGVTGFLAVEFYRLSKRVKQIYRHFDLQMDSMGHILSQILIEEGLAEGVKMEDGSYRVFPPNLPPELRSLLLQTGQHLPRGGGSNADSPSEKPSDTE
jgi:hypothetical protein